jgi:hypothetical protein
MPRTKKTYKSGDAVIGKLKAIKGWRGTVSSVIELGPVSRLTINWANGQTGTVIGSQVDHAPVQPIPSPVQPTITQASSSYFLETSMNSSLLLSEEAAEESESSDDEDSSSSTSSSSSRY